MTNSRTAQWTPELKRLKAISVRQPWAWLIVNGFKDVENRSWRTHHRGPVLIHAGLNLHDFSDDKADEIYKKYRVEIPERLQRGGIVGTVCVVGCHERHPSQWHVPGKYAWELVDPVILRFRACSGALGFFKPKFIE